MRTIAKLAVLGASTLALTACGLILGIPGADEVKNDLDASTADGAPVEASADGPASDGPIGDGPAADATCNADLASDTHHCGVCGHDCLGGACKQAKCQPVKVVGSSSLAPFVMTLSGNILYFTNIKGNALGSMARALKTATNNDTPAIVLSDWSSKEGTPYGISASGTDVYFGVYTESALNSVWQGALMRCPSETCPGTPSVAGIDAYAIATDGANVYSSERAYVASVDTYRILKRGMDLSNPILVGTVGTSTNWITLTTTGEILWGDSDGLWHCPTAGCGGPPQKLASPWDKSVEAIAIDDTTVFFTSNPYGGVATLQSVPRGGGLPVQLTTNDLVVPFGVAADATYVYVAEIGDVSLPTTGRVFRCPRAGCGANDADLEVLFVGENPRTVVSDTNALYFGTREGNIYRLAK